MVVIRCNFDDIQEKIGSCPYGSKYFLIGFASITGLDNSLIFGKRDIVTKM